MTSRFITPTTLASMALVGLFVAAPVLADPLLRAEARPASGVAAPMGVAGGAAPAQPPVAAQSPAPLPASSPAPVAQEPRICRSIETLGTRLRTRTLCRTAAQWNALDRPARSTGGQLIDTPRYQAPDPKMGDG
jgi:transposase InsO family protein